MVVVTASAVAFAGAVKLGTSGAISTLYLAWVGFAGAYCVYHGLRDRSRGWLLCVCGGGIVVTLTFAGFLAIIL